MMGKTEINGHAELMERILYLKSEKLRQEEHLKRSFQDLIFNFGLTTLIKRRTSKNNFLSGMVRIGLNFVSNFLINLFLGKRRSLKGFISTLLVQEFSALLINSNLARIISVARRFLYPVT